MSESTIPVIEPAAEAPKTRRVYRKRRIVYRKTTARSAPDAASVGVGAANAAPAERAQPAREEISDAPLRRMTREERDVDRFSVPRHRQKPDWDVEWKTVTILNQPVDGSEIRAVHDGAWRQEKAKDWPDYVLPGTPPDGPVEQMGLRLYGRPKLFTMQAREEDERYATRQLRDRAQGAQEGRLKGGEGLGDMGDVVRAVPLGVSIEGEAGSTGRVLRR